METFAGNGKDESDTDYIREAAEQVSVFMINAKVSGDNIYCTYADYFQATYEVTKAFIRRGKEKILFMYDSSLPFPAYVEPTSINVSIFLDKRSLT